MNYLKLFLGMLLLFLLSQNLSAQSVDTLGARDTVIIALQNKPLPQQDSVQISPIRLKVTTTSTDTVVQIYFVTSPKFKFVRNPNTPTGAYPITKIGGPVPVDSARVSSAGDTLYVYLRSVSGGGTDSLEISGVFVKAIVSTASYLGTTKDSLTYAIGSVTKNDGTKLFILLPGPTYKPVWTSTTSATVDAGSNFVGSGWVLELQDYFGNRTTDKTTVPTLSPVLASNPATPGNGLLIDVSIQTPRQPGQITYTNIAYTKAEAIKVKATIGSQSDISTASVTVRADAIAKILVSPLAPTPITAGGTVSFTITGLDKFDNPVDGTPYGTAEKVNIKEVQGGTGINVFVNLSTSTGRASYTYNSSNYYTGIVKLTFQGMDAGEAKKTPVVEVSFTVNPGAAATVNLFADAVNQLKDTLQMVVNKTKTIYAEVRDQYGNHIDAGLSGTGVTFYVDSAYHGAVSSASGSVVDIGGKKYWAVDYTAPTKSNTFDNKDPNARGFYVVRVKLNATNSVDSLRVIAKSDFPTLVKAYAIPDSTVEASDSTYSSATIVTVVDTSWDQYGNPSVGYTLKHSVIGTGGFRRGTATSGKVPLVADSLIRTGSGSGTTRGDAGIVKDLIYVSGPRAGKDTIVISYGTTVLARIPITVTPSSLAKVKFDARRIDATAGQTVYTNLELRDQFDNHINATSSDSQNVTLTLVRGNGTILNSGKPVSITSDKKLRIGYTTYALAPDTAVIRAVLGSATPDTVWIYTILPGGLASYGVTTARTSAFVGDSVKITFEAKDSAGNRIYTYNARGWKVVVSGDTSAPGFRVNDFYVSGWDTGKASPKYFRKKVDPATLTVFLPDSIFKNGTANLYFRSNKASSGLVLTLVDTAKNVSASSASIKWLPLGVAKYKVIPDSLTYTILSFPRNIGYKVWPLDTYDNLNTDSARTVNIATNVGDEVNVGSNPKFVKGLSAFTAQVVRGGALYTTGLVLYAYDAVNPSIFGVSDTIRFNILVKVEQDNAEIPKEFALYQNYPNPFNPATEIKFDIPKESHVKIVIYDITGKEVRTLVDEVVKPGAYRILWDGTDNSGNKVTSGIYFYRMIAGSYVSVKKMVLIK
jgi:hypothetical protein